MAQFVFTLFGAFNMLANGESVTGFRTDKERALPAYLALEAERPVSRSTLVNLFWSEMRDNLRKTLHRLRHTLDAAVPDAAIPGSGHLFHTELDVEPSTEILAPAREICQEGGKTRG